MSPCQGSAAQVAYRKKSADAAQGCARLKWRASGRCGGGQTARAGACLGRAFSGDSGDDRGAFRAQTEAIRNHPSLSVAEKETAIINLNGDAHWLGVDAQNRVVLPQELVQWLELQRDVVQFSTGSVVLLWHPDEWQRWKEVDAAWQPPQPPEDVPGVLLL